MAKVKAAPKGETFRNRIVEYGVKPADQFMANPKNARVHPQFQRDVMKDALETVGFVAPVIESKSGVLLDGHERVWQGLQKNSPIPFVVVDVDESEEDYVLATFDPITALAAYDVQQLSALLENVNSDSPAIQQMLSDLATGFQIPGSDEWGGALGGLADGDRAPFQQMTFTLHDGQAETVKRALDVAKHMGAFVDSDNENSNGNALARICETFVTDHE